MNKRDEWIHRYKTDPAFRLKRLEMLSRLNRKKRGGFQSTGAYESEISRAKHDISALKGKHNDR